MAHSAAWLAAWLAAVAKVAAETGWARTAEVAVVAEAVAAKGTVERGWTLHQMLVVAAPRGLVAMAPMARATAVVLFCRHC